MKRMVVGMSCMMVLWTGGLVAQAVAANPVPRASRGTDLLTRKVTVHVKDVSLSRAVDMIAESAGVFIQYSAKALQARPGTVTLGVDQQPLGVALEKLLMGTSLRAVPDGATQLSIVDVNGSTFSVSEGTLVGKVTNSRTKKPIAGARVTVAGQSSTAVTGDDGTFRIPIAPGKHMISIRAVGYVRAESNVTIDEGATNLEFALDPSASVLDEVVVTGTVVATERKAIATPITVITAGDIEKRGITRVEQLFRGEVPGVVALETGSQVYQAQLGKMASSNIMSRGSSGLDNENNPLKTFIDGVEIVDPAYLGTIDPQSIERIEIVTGPQAATIYGSGAMGGVMQIFTKKGTGQSSPDVTLSLRYGMLESNLSNGHTPVHNHTLNVAGGTGPEFSYAGSFSYNYSGQWRPDLYSRKFGGSVGAAYHRGDLNVRGSVSKTVGSNGTSGSSTQFESPIWANMMGQLGGGNANSPVLNRGIRASQIVSNIGSQTLSLNVDYRLFPWLMHQLTIGASRNQFDLDPVAPVFSGPSDSLFEYRSSNSDRTSWSYNATVQPGYLGFISQTLLFGMSGSQATSTNLEGLGADEITTKLAETSVTRSIPTKNIGGFARWQLGIADQLYLTLAVRGEHNPFYGQDHSIDWTPNYGATYTWEHNDLTVKFLGSYGRATRPPSPEMREAQWSSYTTYREPHKWQTRYGNPHLTPEYSRGPQGGIEIYYGQYGSLTLNHYQQIISNLIENVPVDSVRTYLISNNALIVVDILKYVNSATIRQRGWEATGSILLGPLSVKGTYSWSDSRIIKVNPHQRLYYEHYAGDQVGMSPTHTGSVIFSYASGGTNVTLSNSIIGKSRRYARDHWLFYIDHYRRLDSDKLHATVFDDVIRSHAGYVKSDLAVSQRINPWINATVNVTNLGNSFGQESGVIWPTTGRQTLIGISLRKPR